MTAASPVSLIAYNGLIISNLKRLSQVLLAKVRHFLPLHLSATYFRLLLKTNQT